MDKDYRANNHIRPNFIEIFNMIFFVTVIPCFTLMQLILVRDK